MTRFLRFEVGGGSALIWMLLFLAPYFNIPALIQIDATKLFAIIFSSITLSIPLGNYIHQFTDAVFNPFARRRLILWPRAVVRYIQSEVQPAQFRDALFQAVLVFSKAQSRSRSGADLSRNVMIDFSAQTIREEIANRYSYYYARIENGLVAPFFGAAFAVLLINLLSGTAYIRHVASFSPYWIVLAWLVVGVPIVWRIPQLFRELDDLEVSLVSLQKDCWPNPMASPQAEGSGDTSTVR